MQYLIRMSDGLTELAELDRRQLASILDVTGFVHVNNRYLNTEHIVWISEVDLTATT